MSFFITLHRRLEWQLILTYLFIIIVELILIATISGTPSANVIRSIAFPAVLILSIYIARHRIVNPIQEMTEASARIAAGDYHERLPVYSNIELGNLALSFNQMAEALEKTEQHRVQLISDVAHELRTPLSSIKASMEGLIDKVLEIGPDTFLDVQREVSRLQRLVHNLDELSRAEAGQILLHKQSVNLAKLIDTARARLDIQYEDKGVALTADIAPNLPDLQVDPDHITQILLNLLGNALQYTPTGGRVMVRVFQENQSILTEITDSGTGIPPEDIPHIFERFYRVDKSRARASGGSGIGLTISKHLVKAHNGRIWATSAGLDQGSTFIFTLPLSSVS